MLLNANQKLQIKLAGAVASAQPTGLVGYADIREDASDFVPRSSSFALNSTTAVDVLAAPGTNFLRQLKFLSLYNADSAVVNVTLQVDDSSTVRVIGTAQLEVGGRLEYVADQGFRVYTATGAPASDFTIDWGEIGGTLSDQADLQAALDAKLDDSQLDTDGTLAANSDAKIATQKAVKTYADAKVIDSIADSDTTHAPSRNAVFDALALKLDTATAASTYQPLDAQLTSLAGLSYTGNTLKVVRVNAGETDFELATDAGGITALTGDVTASGSGSVAATLATAQPAVHTWALAQTFTVAPVFTDQEGSRNALGLNPKYAFETCWDAASIPTANTGEAWAVIAANSGAVAAVNPLSQANAVGYASLTTVTSATSRAAVGSHNGAIRFGNGRSYWRSRQELGALSDATDTFTVRIGFQESSASAAIDGAFFRYTHSVNSGKWQAVCISNSDETGSAIDTGVTAVAGTDTLFEITVNAAGTSAEFKIDGSVVATIASNIPTGSGRETGYGFAVFRSAGTASKVGLNVDYGYVRVDFTSTR